MLTATGAPRYSAGRNRAAAAESTSSGQPGDAGPLESSTSRPETVPSRVTTTAKVTPVARPGSGIGSGRVNSTASGLNCGATIPVRSCTGFSFEPGLESASSIAASESGLCTVPTTLAAANAQTAVTTPAAAASQTRWRLSASPRTPVVRATSRSAAMRLSTMPPAARRRSASAPSTRPTAASRTARLSSRASSAIRPQAAQPSRCPSTAMRSSTPSSSSRYAARRRRVHLQVTWARAPSTTRGARRGRARAGT